MWFASSIKESGTVRNFASRYRLISRATLRATDWRRLTLIATIVFVGLSLSLASAQTTSTWAGGSGNWGPCPNQGGTANWDTCNANPPVFPDGNFNAVIPSGTVNATGATIQDLSLGSGATLNVAPNSLEVEGASISNNGSILIPKSNGLYIFGTVTTTLSGSGTVMMTDPATRFAGSNGTPMLINQQTISGIGALGLGGLGISNQGSIFASGGELDIQPNTLGFINTGLLQAQTGSKLVLIGAGNFTNTGGTIKSMDGSSILLQANITGGTITTAGSGNYFLAPPGTGSGLTNVTNAGTFNVTAGAGLGWTGTITNTGTFNLPGEVDLKGSVTLQGSGSVLMSGSGVFNGFNTGSLTNSQLIHGGGTFGGLVSLTNTGTIHGDNPSTFLQDNSVTNNTGTLEASGGGTLQLNGVVNNTGGTITAQNESTVIITNIWNGSINGGTLNSVGTGAIVSQNGVLDGTVNIPTNAGTLNGGGSGGYNLFFQGTVNNTGIINMTGTGCIGLNKPATLTGTGILNLGPTNCIFGSGNAFTNESTIQGAGTIGDSNPMPITNKGTIIANTPNTLIIQPDISGFSNLGTLIVDTGSTMQIAGPGPFKDVVKGKLTGGIYSLAGTLDVYNASIVTNTAPIALSGPSAQIFDTFSGVSAFAKLASNTGKGTFSLTLGQNLATVGNFTNSGTITIDATSSFTAGGSFKQTGGSVTVDGTLTAPAGYTMTGGKLFGTGKINATFSSTGKGVVTVGDSVKTTGILSPSTFSQDATGVLDMQIGGHTAGTQYSQLAVGNGVSLSGILNLKRINSFLPKIGDSFTLITGSAITGTFTTVNGTAINSAEHFQINYSGTAVTATVVGP